MEWQEAIDAIEAGKAAPTYALVGGEGFLADRLLEALKRKVAGRGGDAPKVESWECSEASVREMLQDLRTPSLFATQRLVLLRRVEDASSATLDSLATYLEAPSSFVHLALIASKIDGRSRFARVAKAQKAWVDLVAPKGRALRLWLERSAARRGLELAPGVVDRLLDDVGDELAGLDDALERLSLYAGDRKRLSIDDVDRCIARSRSESLWHFLDALSAGERSAVMKGSAALLADREAPLKLLAMVIRQVRILMTLRACLDEGMSESDAAKRAGVPPFKARDTARDARRCSRQGLQRAFALLSQADRSMKGSPLPSEIVLQRSLLELCDLLHPPR